MIGDLGPPGAWDGVGVGLKCHVLTSALRCTGTVGDRCLFFNITFETDNISSVELLLRHACNTSLTDT